MRTQTLFALAGLLVACGGGPSSSNADVADGPVTHELTLFHSARLEGEIEPCGCPKDPMGGLSRRNLIIEEQRAQGPVAVVDGGLSLNVPARANPPLPGGATAPTGPPRDLDQRRIKAELIVDSLLLGGLDAMALGATDWALGSGWVRSMIDEKQAPLVAANLWCDGTQPYPGAIRVERGGRTLVFAGVTAGKVEGCEVREPGPALRDALNRAGPADLRVVLLPIDRDGMVSVILASGMDADMVVDGRGQVAQVAPERRHNAWLLSSGTGGKFLGRAHLRWSEGGKGWAPEGYGAQLADRVRRSESRVAAHKAQAQSVVDDSIRERIELQVRGYEEQLERHREALDRYERSSGGTHRMEISAVPLPKDMDEHPATRALVQAALEQIRAAVPDSVVYAARAANDGFGETWAGSAACVSCHPTEHAQWLGTRHADAWQTLVDEGREVDSACFGCHATGVDQPDGPVTAVEAARLANVQCEACHGPSKAHAASPAEVRPAGVIAPRTCMTCHDGDRDGGRFDYDSYLPKIRHGE